MRRLSRSTRPCAKLRGPVGHRETCLQLTSGPASRTLLRSRISADEFEVWFAPLGARSAADRLTLVAPSRVYADYIRDHYLPAPPGLRGPGRRPRGGGDARHRGRHPPGASPIAPRRPAQPTLHVCHLRARPLQPVRPRGGSVGRREPRSRLQPALPLRRLRSRQDPPPARHRQPRSSARNPRSRVRYVPTENFVNELINSIRLQRMAAFRDAYRSVQMLLLDDVHILAGKERTQEEFFHTFNALHEAGHQIVLTSDTSPAAIQGLEERLRTRFVWGLVADIQPPDLETKCAIIREKAHTEGVDLPDDVVLFIARRVRENVRELEGYLNRVIIYCTLTGQARNPRNRPQRPHAAAPRGAPRHTGRHHPFRRPPLRREGRRPEGPRQPAIRRVPPPGGDVPHSRDPGSSPTPRSASSSPSTTRPSCTRSRPSPRSAAPTRLWTPP